VILCIAIGGKSRRILNSSQFQRPFNFFIHNNLLEIAKSSTPIFHFPSEAAQLPCGFDFPKCQLHFLTFVNFWQSKKHESFRSPRRTARVAGTAVRRSVARASRLRVTAASHRLFLLPFQRFNACHPSSRSPNPPRRKFKKLPCRWNFERHCRNPIDERRRNGRNKYRADF